MAKLFWWLTVFISCLVNSVSPFHMEEVGFIIDSYYKGTYTGELNASDAPWAIYQQFFLAADEVYHPCNPNQFTLETARSSFKAKYGSCKATTGTWGNKVYFLALPDGVTDYTSYSIPEGTLVPILAPEDCTKKTRLSESNRSTYMQLQTSTGYTLVISGMECWFCCTGYTPEDGANYQHMAVSDSDYSDKFASSTVIGLANSNTRIAIYDSNNVNITLAKYFTTSDADWSTTIDGSKN